MITNTNSDGNLHEDRLVIAEGDLNLHGRVAGGIHGKGKRQFAHESSVACSFRRCDRLELDPAVWLAAFCFYHLPLMLGRIKQLHFHGYVVTHDYLAKIDFGRIREQSTGDILDIEVDGILGMFGIVGLQQNAMRQHRPDLASDHKTSSGFEGLARLNNDRLRCTKVASLADFNAHAGTGFSHGFDLQRKRSVIGNGIAPDFQFSQLAGVGFKPRRTEQLCRRRLMEVCERPKARRNKYFKDSRQSVPRLSIVNLLGFIMPS